MATTCTPAGVLDKYKCLACVSDSEMLMLIALALAAMNGYDLNNDLATIREESKCFTCLTESQTLQAIAAILGDAYLSTYTVPELYEIVKCAHCANGEQIRAAIVYLLCRYYNR